MFRRSLKEQFKELSTLHELISCVMVDFNSVQNSFVDIITACTKFFPLPVTVAACERSFSKLTLIRNYQRSQISRERFSNLGMLSIENEKSKEINIAKVIDSFANKTVG